MARWCASTSPPSRRCRCWTPTVTGDSTLKGFNGGFTAGDYGYLVPYHNGASYFGKVVRFDLATFSQVSVLDVPTAAVDSTLKGFYGGFAAGDYGYLVPYKQRYLPVWQGGALQIRRLRDAAGVQVLDVPTVAGDSTLKGFRGGFAAGHYGYLVPYHNGATYFGKVVRFDLATFSQVSVLDVPTVAGDSTLKGFNGGFAAGDYGYLVPYRNGAYFGKAVRFDLDNFSQVSVLDVPTVTGDSTLKGFIGGFTAGDYGYLVPYFNGAWFGKAVRFDLATFSQVSVLDVPAVTGDSTLKGFNGGFTAGDYGYLVPHHNGAYFGKAVRFPTTTIDFSSIDLTLAKVRPRINWF